MAMQDNWGSIAFLILYLGIIWTLLFIIIIKNIKNHSFKQRDNVWKWTFLAYFLLAFGDNFHLGFRIYIFFGNLDFNSEFTKFLFGTGYIATSITMTYFYVAFLHVWAKLYGKKYSTPNKVKNYFVIIYIAFIIRVILIFLPYNHWYDYEPALDFGFDFGIITSIPLYVIGLVTVGLMYKSSKAEARNPSGINPDWNKSNYKASLWFMVSFICYTITLVTVVYIPVTGLFMIPKTIAYLIAMYYHYKYLLNKEIL